MHIKSKLTEQDYINVNFVLLYRKTAVKIMTGFFGLLLIISIVTAIFSIEFTNSQIVSPLVMLLVMPLVTYFAARRNFRANSRISETIEYIFEKENLVVKGESFSAQLSWDKIYKVTQTKHWVLIWQNRQVANCINKRDIWDEQIQELKELCNQYKVKNNL